MIYVTTPNQPERRDHVARRFVWEPGDIQVVSPPTAQNTDSDDDDEVKEETDTASEERRQRIEAARARITTAETEPKAE